MSFRYELQPDDRADQHHQEEYPPQCRRLFKDQHPGNGSTRGANARPYRISRPDRQAAVDRFVQKKRTGGDADYKTQGRPQPAEVFGILQ